MNQQKNLKKQAREARQARQANRVVSGIIIALVLIMALAVAAYYLV